MSYRYSNVKEPGMNSSSLMRLVKQLTQFEEPLKLKRRFRILEYVEVSTTPYEQ